MKHRKLVIFGSGQIAQLAKHYFESDSCYEVTAFTVDTEYCHEEKFENLPLLPFETIQGVLTPHEVDMFIALSYTQMNKLRAQKLLEARGKGYNIASYISSKCSYLSQNMPGENAFILEDNTIQPYVKIGTNVTLWSGNHIGHHSEIGHHNFISSHVVISGGCKISSNCFIGVNAAIANNITISKATLIGAGAVIIKDTEANGVYVANRSIKIEKESHEINL